jgi:hypothetical protein
MFLYIYSYSDGSGFSIKRFDIIILVLSNVAVVGSHNMAVTEKNIMLRLVLLRFVLQYVFQILLMAAD